MILNLISSVTYSLVLLKITLNRCQTFVPKNFLSLGFGFGYNNFWVLGLSFGFGYKNFWVLCLGFGYNTQTQNPIFSGYKRLIDVYF